MAAAGAGRATRTIATGRAGAGVLVVALGRVLARGARAWFVLARTAVLVGLPFLVFLVAAVEVPVLVPLVVVVLAVSDDGRVGDHACPEAHGQESNSGHRHQGAFDPGSFPLLRLAVAPHLRLTPLDALLGGHTVRRNRIGVRGWHLRRLVEGRARGQLLGAIRSQIISLGQDRGALGLAGLILALVRHGQAPFC